MQLAKTAINRAKTATARVEGATQGSEADIRERAGILFMEALRVEFQQQPDQLPQAHGLRHAPPWLRKAVVAAAIVVQVRIGPLAGFYDEPLFGA
ncbi:MAG: hypothetical protein ABSG03_05865 [Bryobacteraceae bacterium]